MAQSFEDARRRRQQPSGARVPPHNLAAEESLLGAMLLSRDAIVAAIEVQLSPDDFYKPAHGHIYDAITSLYAQGEPADPVTVAEELRRAGILDAIGGGAVLLSLQAGTPAIGNATRYAHIVEEHSLLRRLIGVAGEIAEIGYGLPDDVPAAVDEAEALVFEVAQRRVTDSMAPIRDLLERHLDHIEALYERNQDITGVPTGFVDLDKQLAGLQPSNLVIVGARPGMGKALAVGTPIPTPTGWTTMGALGPGDQVIDSQGRPCRVTYATPVMFDRCCYEISFDDGSVLVADADHQWFAYAHDRGMRRRARRVVTTRQMIDEGVHVDGDRRPKWSIPLARPLELPDADLPLDPYVLGCWLGDGSSSASAMTTGDIGAGGSDGAVGVLTRELRTVALLVPHPKHIPDAYLRSSVAQRSALLQGLLDTRQMAAQGTAELCLGDRHLARQARELVCSLGHKPGPVRQRSIRLADGRLTTAWRLRWTPGEKSAAVARRAVTGIRPISPVPVRCITVDSPDHLYLAGESMIPTHNTSFALGLAAHASLEASEPVLLFSLEMSHRELTQRLLCSEARVDATRMRNGRLLEADWPKISHAVGRLAEAQIFIDDNPRLTIMEIRAKARRLKSREGLGMIVVDYLQLMTGRADSENRQVEVSEISRGLKILARELEIPVVALSQLSRGLETRADKRPILADLRESGCLTADTRILRADTGEEVSLGELVLSQEHPTVWSVDEHQRLVPAQLVNAFPSGIKPVFELRLASGRTVNATANHRFLTVDGWARLDTLQVGSSVAVPRRVPGPLQPNAQWSSDELALLAHMIGDGSMGPGFKYATADAANKELVEGLARRLFGIRSRSTKTGNTWSLWFPSPYRLTHDVNHPLRNWLEPHGLWKSRAWTKFIPEAMFGLGDDHIALFLHHLWATDGSITIERNGRGPTVSTYYASTSRRLASDVQRLLLRLGIRSTIGTSKKQRAGRPDEGVPHYRDAYSVRIQGARSQARFLRIVGCHGERGARIPEALEVLDSMITGSRELADMATSDLDWDRVVEIVSVGEQPTFDATVLGTHNFVADGIVAHNSLEQDADVVIFLYRDELYNRESPDRGTAEIIVAKHRNGPTGVTHLAFLDHYTRFANMARGV